MTTSSEKPSNMVSKARRPKHKYRENDPEQFTQHPRPSLSYNELIIEAIQNSSEGMLSLQDIYDYIQDEYPFFKESKIVKLSLI